MHKIIDLEKLSLLYSLEIDRYLPTLETLSTVLRSTLFYAPDKSITTWKQGEIQYVPNLRCPLSDHDRNLLPPPSIFLDSKNIPKIFQLNSRDTHVDGQINSSRINPHDLISNSRIKP